jgi:PleD family two-component response regulator
MNQSDDESEHEVYASVLVLQDYLPEELELINAQLRRFGCNVLPAADGRRALAIAAAELPDLIIANLSMHDMKGAEFCSQLRAKSVLGAIPLLLVSDLPRNSAPVVEVLNSGANDYLRIPYEPMQLLAKTARLIERKRAAEGSRQRDRYVRLLMEHSNDNITVLNQEGSTLYESPSVERITGYKPDDLLYRNNFELIHPDDRERVIETFRAGLLGDHIRQVEYRHRHKNG